MATYTDRDNLPPDVPTWTMEDVRGYCGVTMEGLPEEQAVILALFTRDPDAPAGQKADVLPAIMPVSLARELAAGLLQMAEAVEEAGRSIPRQ